MLPHMTESPDFYALVAAAIAYPTPPQGDTEELNALLEMARPQFKALAAHLVSQPPEHFKPLVGRVFGAFSVQSSPYREHMDSGFACKPEAREILAEEVAKQPSSTDEQVEQVIAIHKAHWALPVVRPSPRR